MCINKLFGAKLYAHFILKNASAVVVKNALIDNRKAQNMPIRSRTITS